MRERRGAFKRALAPRVRRAFGVPDDARGVVVYPDDAGDFLGRGANAHIAMKKLTGVSGVIFIGW